MTGIRAWLVRLFGLFGGRRRDLDLADELNGHLDAHIADNIRSGMTPEDARRDALLKLGGIAQAQERVRERRSFLVLDHLRQDVRYALRTLRRDWSFAVGVVLMLAAGIGLNAGIFTVINSVILRDLPLPDPGRLVIVAERTSRFETPTSWPDFMDLRERNKSLESTAAFSRVSDFTFRAGGDARNIKGSNVSPPVPSFRGDDNARPSIRVANVAEDARLQRRRDCDARARHRRKHRHLQRHQRGADRAATVQRSVAAGRAVGRTGTAAWTSERRRPGQLPALARTCDVV
jgi:hypothetical protein